MTRLIASLLLVLTVLSARFTVAEETKKQSTFESPESAFAALRSAWERNSDDQVLDILGHENKELVVQSDKEESSQGRARLTKLVAERLRIAVDGDKATGYLGVKAWPFPIPLMKKDGAWMFDTAAGKEEILNRRIGRNELKAIALLDAYDDAQRVYASRDHTSDKVLKYAQKLISAKGKEDGLYYAAKAGEEASPLAALFDDGPDFLDGNGTDIPYHGYFFKIMTKQGANPPNGKYDYVINGNMIAGFAIVAWPADYGASGIMTFVESHQGVIYQKNLGADTAKLASAMDEYNPDATWTEVKPEEK